MVCLALGGSHDNGGLFVCLLSLLDPEISLSASGRSPSSHNGPKARQIQDTNAELVADLLLFGSSDNSQACRAVHPSLHVHGNTLHSIAGYWSM